MMVQSYLRRGKRSLERLALDPRVRCAGGILAYGGSGFLLSAASLGNACQPLAMGMICAATGWRTLVMALGAMVGYPTFWGSAGSQGIVWSAAAGLLALLVGKKEESREQPLMIPAITAFLMAVTGLCFRLLVGDRTPFGMYCLRILLTFFSGVLFTQLGRCRDPVTEWVAEGVAVLALAQVSLGPYLDLGCLAAGLLAVGGAFPAAALAGVALDLAGISRVPMTAVLCLAYFIRLIPFDKRWQQYAAPVVACAVVCAGCGIWDPVPFPGLMLGGCLGSLLPPQPSLPSRRRDTGVAQVRLELGAEVMQTVAQLFRQMPLSGPEDAVLLEKVRHNACEGCPAGKNCAQRDCLTLSMLRHPLEADCSRQGRLVPELRRAGEQQKVWRADRQRREEYRQALVQQYSFLSDYLRTMADRLPRSAGRKQAAYRIEVSSRTRGRERTSGDRCLAFSGPECCYYVLLCDGMGTGAGAAWEGAQAGNLLRQMLTAGFPADHALRTLNSLLALQGCAGAVTVDLAEIRLDVGHATVYKWGAAPSWVLTRAGAEKIGTAAPPPGISVTGIRETVEKLSLRRGEVLILLSDGVDGEGIQHLSVNSPDLPPGELAAKLLESSGRGEDDATAAVIKLRPTSLAAL